MLRVKELGFIIGLGIVGLVFVAAVIGPWLTGHDPFAQDLNARLIPPFWMEGGSSQHWFGTDQLGRDYLTRLLYGARISLFIGVLTVVTSGIIGTSLGVLGGFYGGRIDDAVLFVITCRLSIPVVLVAVPVSIAWAYLDARRAA